MPSPGDFATPGAEQAGPSGTHPGPIDAEEELRAACDARGLKYIGPGEGKYGNEINSNLATHRTSTRAKRHALLAKAIAAFDRAPRDTGSRIHQTPSSGAPQTPAAVRAWAFGLSTVGLLPLLRVHRDRIRRGSYLAGPVGKQTKELSCACGDMLSGWIDPIRCRYFVRSSVCQRACSLITSACSTV